MRVCVHNERHYIGAFLHSFTGGLFPCVPCRFSLSVHWVLVPHRAFWKGPPILAGLRRCPGPHILVRDVNNLYILNRCGFYCWREQRKCCSSPRVSIAHLESGAGRMIQLSFPRERAFRIAFLSKRGKRLKVCRGNSKNRFKRTEIIDLSSRSLTSNDFRQKIKSVSDSLDFSVTQSSDSDETGEAVGFQHAEASIREAESMIMMQIFSPLLTSYRIMNQQFHNSYDCISCEDGSTVAFYENTGFLLIAIAKSTINAVHLVRLCFDIMQHVCGPSLSMLKHSPTHSELASLLIHTFLRLRKTSQSLVTEALQYEPVSEEMNASIIQVLECAVEDLCERAKIPESKIHILLVNQSSIIAIYSGKGASELKTDEILFLVVVANAFTHAKLSTRHSLISLESCVPYTIHIQRAETGLNIIVLIEVGLKKFADTIFSLVQNILSASKKREVIQKQMQDVKEMAQRINYRQWSDSIIWRPNQAHNDSAMSALARQLLHGYEVICLSPSLLFGSVEQVSDVIDNIRISIPVPALLQPCRLTPLLKLYPGLVHFVLVDRINHRMISPILPLESKDSTFNDMWKTFHTSLDWLNEGMYNLLWNDKQLCYSHAIWVEDGANKKLPWKSTWDVQNGSLGYPGVMGSSFYDRKLIKAYVEDEEVEPVHYLQLFCIHLALASPNHVREQSERLANHLKRYIYPSMARLEDLF